MSDLRPWEADLIEAVHYDRIVLMQRWYREEMEAAKQEIKDDRE